MMRFQEVRLIIADVDGTLLNSHHELTLETLSAIKELRADGVSITLATGRILPSVADIAASLNIEIPLILANGALIQKRSGEILYQCPFPASLMKLVIAEAKKHSFEIALYTPDRIIVRKLNYNTSLVMEYREPCPVQIGEWSRLPGIWSSQVCKIVVINRENTEELDEIGRLLRKQSIGRASVQASVPYMLEVTVSPCTKARGLLSLCSHLGISSNEVLAIGDGLNDVEMFKVSGISVAMGNASANVKRAADIVIGSNDENGIADFLRRTFLPQCVRN